MTVHAKLSASGAHRWMACPGSVALESTFQDETSEFAAEGTAAHFLGEQCLESGRDTSEYLRATIHVAANGHCFWCANDGLDDNGKPFPDGFAFTVDQEMAVCVQEYVDYVRAIPGKLFVEKKVSFSDYVPDGFGTADAIIIDDGKATVVDLKYGRDVNVDAEQNPQAMLYGLGAIQEYDFLYGIDEVTLVIHQPRIDGVSEWTISTDDLVAWGEETVKPAAAATTAAKPTYLPGEKQCKFCKAKATCPALANHVMDVATEGFETAGAPTQAYGRDEPLSLEDIAEILPHTALIKDWLENLWKYAETEALQGETVPGFKLVTTDTKRKWVDQGELTKALKKTRHKIDVVLPRKPLTIGQAEKLLGKDHKILADFAVKPDGQPKLVSEDDRRPALTINPADGFEEVAA